MLINVILIQIVIIQFLDFIIKIINACNVNILVEHVLEVQLNVKVVDMEVMVLEFKIILANVKMVTMKKVKNV